MDKISVEELRQLYERGVSGTEIARRLGISPTAVYHWLRMSDVKIWGHMPKNWPALSPSKDLAYILGVLKSDGSVGFYGKGDYRIMLISTDERFNKSFADSLQRIGLYSHTSIRKPRKSQLGKKPQYFTLAHSRIFYDWYKNLTLNGLEELLLNNSLAAPFVQGFYEGDGSLKTRGDLSISNSDKGLLCLVAKLLRKLGFQVNVTGPYFFNGIRNRKPMYLIQVGKTKANKILEIIKPCIKNSR